MTSLLSRSLIIILDDQNVVYVVGTRAVLGARRCTVYGVVL